MTFRGHIQNGRVEFDKPVPMPDGTVVRVQPETATVKRRAGRKPNGKSSVAKSTKGAMKKPAVLADRFRSIIGIARGLPADFAAQIDHYARGTPKK